MINTSRKFQWLQHFISGTKECIDPTVAAISALYITGNASLILLIGIFLIKFTLGRVSSELAYQIQMKVLEERLHKNV